MEFLQQIVNGLALGSIYSLIAIGYTMVYGIIGLINFAHGDIYMVGAYIGFFAAFFFHMPFIPTLLLSMVLCALLGVVIEKLAYRPLRKYPKIVVLITAIGVSLLLENLFRWIVGPEPKPFPKLFVVHNYHIGGLMINNIQILIFGISILLILISKLTIITLIISPNPKVAMAR